MKKVQGQSFKNAYEDCPFVCLCLDEFLNKCIPKLTAERESFF